MTFFDRFAERMDTIVSSAWFFAVCAFGVILWTIGLPFAGVTNDTYHLYLNSPTTGITFLLVGLAANAARRGMNALNRKLDAVLEALKELPETDSHKVEIAEGIEKHIGT